jgi:hypothetical protein
VKVGSNYRLPKDNDKRLLALPLMAAAIAADGFGAEEFGSVAPIRHPLTPQEVGPDWMLKK